MPIAPTQVSTDDIFDVLVRLACPAVFYRDDGPPGPEDLPQLLGVLTAAVDRLTIAHAVPLDRAQRRAWAAGYLQTLGAGTPCGSRRAMDVTSVRLQLFENLIEGLATPDSPMAPLMRACLGAAARYSVAASAAVNLAAGTVADDTQTRALVRDQLDRAHALLVEATGLDAQLRAGLEES